MRRAIPIVAIIALIAAFPLTAWSQTPDGGASGGPVVHPGTAPPNAGTSPGAVGAQQGNVSRIYLIKPRAGMDAEWLAAAAEHVQWHRDNNDTWTWIAVYIETGKYTGMYGWVTIGHQWSDFDDYDATLGPGDTENVGETFGPLTDHYVSWFGEALLDVSNPLPTGTIAPLVQVVQHHVDPTHEQAFVAAIAKAHMALQEDGFATHYVWVREIGGEGPVYSLVLPMESWAEMAEPDRSVAAILEETMGRFDAGELMSTFADAVVSTESWVQRTLPDLTCCGNQ